MFVHLLDQELELVLYAGKRRADVPGWSEGGQSRFSELSLGLSLSLLPLCGVYLL